MDDARRKLRTALAEAARRHDHKLAAAKTPAELRAWLRIRKGLRVMLEATRPK